MVRSEQIRKREKEYRKRRNLEDPTYFIGKHIKKSANNRKLDHPHTQGEYRKWFINQKQVCYFCGHSLKTANNFLIKNNINKIDKNLSVDRLDSKKGYLLNNIVLACRLCNSSKSNIISSKDFLEIAKKYIYPKLKNYKKNF